MACASPAGAPSRRGVSTRLALAPPALSETHVGRAGLEGDGSSHVFLRDGDPAVPAALLGAVVVAPDGGETTAWVPAWDSRGGSAMRHDGERVAASARALSTPFHSVSPAWVPSGFLVSATLAPGAGGFGALAAQLRRGDGARARVFAHVPRAAAPELRALVGPPETLSTGGALVFVSGRDLRGGADLGILASLEPVALAGGAAASRVESVSSALAVFETPRVAAGAATLRLALGLGCAACPRGSPSSLPLATRPLGRTQGPTTEPKTWFASPAAGGAGRRCASLTRAAAESRNGAAPGAGSGRRRWRRRR